MPRSSAILIPFDAITTVVVVVATIGQYVVGLIGQLVDLDGEAGMLSIPKTLSSVLISDLLPVFWSRLSASLLGFGSRLVGDQE